MIACVDTVPETEEPDIFAMEGEIVTLEARVKELEEKLSAKNAFIDELAVAAGYFPGQAVSARALIARLRDGDR